jgi:hypothetical protein
MNAFREHHQHNIRMHYRCFDRILLNGIIQPLHQEERAPEHFGSVNVEGCQIGPGSTTGVFPFNASGLARMRGQRRMNSAV